MCNNIAPMKKTNMGKRIEYIDALRGFTMLLVVNYHVVFSGYRGDFLENVFSFNNFFGLFRMPLFFFISGFVLYKSNVDWNLPFAFSFLKKKFKVQIIPTLIFFGLLVYIFNYNFTETWLTPAKNGYWFTLTLLNFFLIYSVLCYLGQKIKVSSHVKSLLLAASGVALFVAGTRTFIHGVLGVSDNLICLFDLYHLNFYIFFVVGILTKKYFFLFQRLIDNRYVMGGLLTLFIFLTVFLFKHRLFSNAMINHIYLLTLSISGIYVTFAFFRKNQSWFSSESRLGRVMQLVGRRTLDIYLLHFFLLPYHLEIVGHFFTEYHFPALDFIVTSTLSVIIISLSLLVIQLLRTSNLLAHSLFGAKLTPKTVHAETIAMKLKTKDDADEEGETKVS